MLTYSTGDILRAESEAIINTVNCVGVKQAERVNVQFSVSETSRTGQRSVFSFRGVAPFVPTAPDEDFIALASAAELNCA